MSNLVENEVCNNCIRTIEHIKIYYDNFKNNAADSTRYTSTIMSVAYAALISLLGFTRNNISKTALMAASFCLLVSMGAFLLMKYGKCG
jgi:hypothetical protein